MTATHADSIIDGYLKRLDGELSSLPASRRKEVSSQIAEHIAQARAELTDESDADVLTILDRLGEPDEIAAEARERFDVPADRPGLVEILALVLLAVGGFVLPVPPVPWLLGVALVWRSRIWTPRSKYFGAYLPLVVGLALLLIGALAEGVMSGHLVLVPFFFAGIAAILLPLGSAVFLGFKMGRRLPALGWVAIGIVCLMVYVPVVAIYIPPRESGFLSQEVVADNRNCGGFYGTIQFAPSSPLVARAPISVGICWDGQRVTKTWGPDCGPTYGPGLIVRVQNCTVTDAGDGSLIVSVEASAMPSTAPLMGRSEGHGWRITPDGHVDEI